MQTNEEVGHLHKKDREHFRICCTGCMLFKALINLFVTPDLTSLQCFLEVSEYICCGGCSGFNSQSGLFFFFFFLSELCLVDVDPFNLI